MKVIIQDIANMVGVSKSTISRCLNGGYVGNGNTVKIKEAIKKAGFEANSFARGLKSKQSRLIGMVVPRIDSFITDKTLNGINRKLEEQDYQGIILTSGLNIEKELEQINKLYNQGVGGIIIVSFEISREHVKLANKLPMPILFSGQKSDYISYLVLDDEKIGNILETYIKEQGHKDAVFLGVSKSDREVGILGKKGFYSVFEKECNISFVETGFSFNRAYEAGGEILRHNPTAIICATDNVALGLMRYLLENGKKIPEDISITTFGGYEVGAVTYSSLTAVKIDYKLFGEEIVLNILSLTSGEKSISTCEIPLELMIRESVKSLK